LVEERELKDIKHDDEVLMCTPPSYEAMYDHIPPTQEEENEVNHFPFQIFVDALFYDLEGEQIRESLDVLNPSCYDKGNGMVDNIDELIHFERCEWDVVDSNKHPIYDMEGYVRMFPLQQSFDVTNNFDVWQQDDDIIIEVFQAPKDDLVQCSLDDFRSYLEEFDKYSFEHLDIFYEWELQPPLCSDCDESEDMVLLEKDTCDEVSQPPYFPVSLYVTKDVFGKCVPCPRCFPWQRFLFEFKID